MAIQSTNGTAKKAFIKQLRKSLGVISDACRLSRTSRRTVYNWIESDKKFKKYVDECQDIAIDFVESKLFELIRGIKVQKTVGGKPSVYTLPPDNASVIFFMKTKARHRGYSEKLDVDMNSRSEHVVQVIEFGDQKIEFS